MHVPALPEVDRLVDDLFPEIANAAPSLDAVWHIGGPATGGKSTALQLLGERLSEQGLSPILVAPPMRALDAGPLALTEVSVGLKSCGLLNGQLDILRSADAPWAEKVTAVLGWVSDHADRVVLLCDEPAEWSSRQSHDVSFRAHADEVALALVATAPCRRVVSGALPVGVRARHFRKLAIASTPGEWLRDEHEWGPLAGPATAIAERLGDDLASRSPLEIRLLVAIAALWTLDDLVRWWKTSPGRRDISRALASLLRKKDTGPEERFLRDAWRRLALARRSLSQDLLDAIVSDAPTERARSLLHNCLLYPDDGAFRLHWSLRLDAQEVGRSGDEDPVAMQAELARYYKRRLERREQARDPNALLDEMEAFHHASLSGDAGLLDELRPYFADQLNALGRTLSRDFKQHEEAAAVFERAVRWEPDDDYAHHYLAFNLDILAQRAPEVEAHYQRAIELRADHLWWHSRWVSYLITRGRMGAARRAWNEALDVLGLPDPDAERWIYENLHLWIGRLLVHRGQLDFAEEVLRGIPQEALRSHPGLAAIFRRLRALVEARSARAVFPLSVSPERWWHGPHLCPQRREAGELARWMPGRIDGVDDGVVRAQVAQPPGEDDPHPVFGFLSLEATDFDRWTRDERVADLTAGRFIELGWYGDEDEPIIRVHGNEGWRDRDLPPLFPDPARYLRSAGWVEGPP